MKDGWKLQSIGEIARIKGGKRVPKGYKLLTESTGFPYLRVSEFNDSGSIDLDNLKYVSPEIYSQIKNYGINSTDVYISIAGTIGKSGIIPKELDGACLTENACRLVFQPGINNRFVYYFTLSPEFVKQAGLNTRTAAQPKLSLDRLSRIKFAVPSLSEQQRIVSILDKAFDGITTAKANAEKNLQNARELFESYLENTFSKSGDGWTEKNLEDLGTITSSKRIYKSEYTKTGVPFYRTKEIKELANSQCISSELFISRKRYEELRKQFGVPLPGDVLMTAIGTIGEVYVVETKDEFYFKDGNVLWFKDFNSINPHFLKFALMAFVDNFNKIAHGAAYSALPIERLKSYAIMVPPSKQQDQIVSNLFGLQKECRHLESIYERKLDMFSEFGKSLLHQAFHGQL